VRFHPGPHAADGFAQALTERGEPVVHARWNFGVDAASDQAVSFKLPQRLGQHLLADAANAFQETGKPHFLLAVKSIDHQQRPFVGHALQDLADERLLLRRWDRRLIL